MDPSIDKFIDKWAHRGWGLVGVSGSLSVAAHSIVPLMLSYKPGAGIHLDQDYFLPPISDFIIWLLEV